VSEEQAALMVHSHPLFRRIVPRAATHVAVSLLALAVVLQPDLPVRSARVLDPSCQLAATSHGRRKGWSEKSADDDDALLYSKPTTGGTGSHGTTGYKGHAGGYSPNRVRRFWSHYHRARPGPKERPMEQQPRDQ
jgi:hypothetical protein